MTRRITSDGIWYDEIRFPPPGLPLTMNARHAHWGSKYQADEPWWEAAYLAACMALGASPEARRRPKATVILLLPFRTRRRRDPMNYAATLKPVVDSLVKADVWPDDNPQYVATVEPVLYVSKNPDADVIIRLVYDRGEEPAPCPS